MIKKTKNTIKTNKKSKNTYDWVFFDKRKINRFTPKLINKLTKI